MKIKDLSGVLLINFKRIIQEDRREDMKCTLNI